MSTTTISELYECFKQHPIVSTDTRHLPTGCIFFALKGGNFNGNQFAAEALERGAAYAVIDEPKYHINNRFILVDDVLKSLQSLAQHHRLQFHIPIIAIGGSNGKTTTKELVSNVLCSHYVCHFTKGNLNNHIGVPLTLLAMSADTEVAVIEMGTNQPGDIALLCDITRPTHGLVTNVGKEHLEGFGSLAGVKKAEAELFAYLSQQQGTAFINRDEKHLAGMSKKVTKKVIYAKAETPGRSTPGIIEVQLLAEMPFVQAAFVPDEGQAIQTVQTHLFGRHNFNNIMTAIALGIYFKVPAAKIKSALETYQPSNNRSQIVQRGTCTILLDAYNANPSSMRPALESLKAMPAQRRVAILGDMRELGTESHKEHEAILRLAARLGLDQIILVGPEFGQVNFQKFKALHFSDTLTAKKQWFSQQDLSDTLLLIKGSRGIGLEKLLAE
jgi:UDP-N-acetylmuramoyl-tripeptide--D-alanyl-D-alanine ligase